MRTQTRQDKAKAESLTCALLEGTGLSGFWFGTSFTLRFERSDMKYFNSHKLPWAVELQLLGEWWFNTKEKWCQTVERLAAKETAEPEEPAQAYELVRLRWSEGSTVKAVSFDDEKMAITFANGTFLSASLNSTEDYAWRISVPDICESDEQWSVVCEEGKLFLRTP